jgi:hypothetical protein
MSLRKAALSIGLMAGFVSLAPRAQAADPLPLSGQILGEVRNSEDVAQMGAKVLLLNRFDQPVRESLSDETGKFLFSGLPPGSYSVSVSLASFVPVLRRNIAVLAGSQNLLRVSLSAVFSSVELVPASQARGTLLSDDWKLVLRSSPATRPVLRLVEEVKVPEQESLAEIFSDTTGLVRLSAGDSNPFNGTMQQALGTGFAVETSVYGRTKVRLAGNLGYSAASGMPAAGIRTTYTRSRDGRPGPEFSLTARQVYFPASVGSAVSGHGPALRTAAFSSVDQLDFAEVFRLEYGFTAESVMLFDRMNFFSPFARATYDLGDRGQLKLAYSGGAPPTELLARGGPTDLNEDLAALGQLPRLSRRGGRASVERVRSYEVGYTVTDGSRSYSAAFYRDAVSNGAFLMSGAVGLLGADHVLPDLNTRGYVVNLGSYQLSGFSAAVTQTAGDLEFTLAGGRSGALVAGGGAIVAGDGDALRTQLRQSPRAWVTVQAAASIPATGTHLSASYGWTDFRALAPAHVSLTAAAQQQLGWNISGRQPLPPIGGMRMELNVEMRNLLAQGYLPVSSPEGRTAVITNSPRAVRGGLSFIF